MTSLRDVTASPLYKHSVKLTENETGSLNLADAVPESMCRFHDLCHFQTECVADIVSILFLGALGCLLRLVETSRIATCI
jgi:hypothetical protein